MMISLLRFLQYEVQQLFQQAVGRIRSAQAPADENALDVSRILLVLHPCETYWFRL